MNEQERKRVVSRFFKAAGPNLIHLAMAMEDARDTAFYIKDLRQRIVAINRRNREICNIARVEDALGRSSDELFAPRRAEEYMRLDREVIHAGKPLLNIIHFVPEDRSLSYTQASIYPIFNAKGKIIGTMRFYRVMDKSERNLARFDRLEEVARYINESCRKPLRLADLAKRADLSLTAFKRDFTAAFDMPPGHYILNARINAAIKLLKDESHSLSNIALACGFCDQSHFCRIFTRIRGKSPSAYRRELLSASPTTSSTGPRKPLG